MAYERIQIVGNIGSCDSLISKANKQYIRLTVAVDRSGGRNEHVVWYQVMLFGQLAADSEGILLRYKKGRQILVEGRPHTEAYAKKDGSLAIDNTIIASCLPELLDKRPPP